jgi:hypothetical protein
MGLLAVVVTVVVAGVADKEKRMYLVNVSTLAG